MKKNFFQMGLMLIAALALTISCSKEENAPEEIAKPIVKEAVPFELTVSSPDTKTSTTDASTINWVANDKVNVFHAENGVEPVVYSKNDEFTITSENLASKKFTGSLQDGALDGAKSYDWYVLYPYSSYITTPANTSTGWTQIGSSSHTTAQIQDGNNSKAHLAGQYFPLYGKAENIAAATKPSITLNQALSVIKVHVTNTKATPLTVTEVSFTSPQNITGRFYINFTGATPTYTEVSDKVSKKVTLSVSGGSAISKDNSADFYLAIKPFTASEGDKLKVSVNGEEKILTVGAGGVEFKPGKIKTVNYSFDADPIIYSTGFDYPIVKDGGSTYYNKGDEYEGVDAGGETSWYIKYGNWEGSNKAQLRVYNGTGGGFGELAMKFDCSHVTHVTYDAVANNELTSLTLTPYYSIDEGANWTAISADAKVITTTNTKYKFTVSSTGEHDRVRIKLVVSGSRPASSNTQISIDNLKIYGTGSVLADPAIIASNVSDVPALGGAGRTLTYTIKNFSGLDDVAAAGDGTVVAASPVVSPAGTVTYTVTPNYGTSARNGSITLSSTAEGIDKVVTVAQLGETFSVSGTTITIPKDASTASFTITTPTFGWTAVANPVGEKNLTISGSSSGDGSASAQTITVSSSETAGGEEQTLGTIVVYRNGNESDTQKKTITIKKASNVVTSMYTKVTSITSAAEYLFCEPTNNKVVNSYSSSHLAVTGVTITGGTKVTGNATIDTYTITITALTGADDGYYSICFDGKYLGYNSGTNFQQSTSVASDSYKWSIVIDGETGRATISNKATPARKIAYNGSSDFRPYSTIGASNLFPVLFKKD